MAESGAEPQRVRVLIVDDEPAICKALKVALERLGLGMKRRAAECLVIRHCLFSLFFDCRWPDVCGSGPSGQATAATRSAKRPAGGRASRGKRLPAV